MKAVAIVVAYLSLLALALVWERVREPLMRLGRSAYRLLTVRLGMVVLLSWFVLEAVLRREPAASASSLVLPVTAVVLLIVLAAGQSVSFDWEPRSWKTLVACALPLPLAVALGRDASISSPALALSALAVGVALACWVWLLPERPLERVFGSAVGWGLVAGVTVLGGALLARGVLGSGSPQPAAAPRRAAVLLPAPPELVSWFGEAENLLEPGEAPAGVQEMSSFIGTWSGGRQVLVDFQSPGSVVFGFELARPVSGVLMSKLTAAPDYGIAEFTVDGEEFDVTVDVAADTVIPLEWTRVGSVTLEAGAHFFEVRSVGKDPESFGFKLGIDAFAVVSEELRPLSVE